MTSNNAVDAARVELLLSELRLPAIKLMWAALAARADKEGWPAARFLPGVSEPLRSSPEAGQRGSYVKTGLSCDSNGVLRLFPKATDEEGTSAITEASPYITRTSFTLAQSTVPMAQWAAKNGIKKVVTMVSDYAPGIDAENSFKDAFTKAGGEVLQTVRFPLANPDFSPFLQRAADAKPDAIFVFVPSGQGGAFVKQFVERGLDKAGVKLIGPGDVTDDDLLNAMGHQVIGTVTAHLYSAAHPSDMNKAFVEAFKKAAGFRPNFMAVGGYDGMHLIYEALKKTGGKADGDSLIAAMKGLAWESPRGPVSIDPDTRDIVQNIYIRKVEKVGGELYNVEFATVEGVKDPVKAAKK